jgi:lysophospholipase L1-like esterase
VIAGCGGSGKQPEPSTSVASRTTSIQRSSRSMVTLGDSIASTADQPCACTAFAALFAQRTGVRLFDEAVSGSEARDLLQQLKTDAFVRQIVSNAHDIVIDMGINDLPWNRSDDPCSVQTQSGAVRWVGVDQKCIRRVAREFEATMNAALAQIDRLRANKPTMLRLTTVYNSVLGDTVDPGFNATTAVKPSKAAVASFDAIQCRVARDHHGRCVDVERAFNGPSGSQPATRFLAADHLHVSQHGQEVIAELLYHAR